MATFEPIPVADSVSVKEGKLGNTFVLWLQRLVNLVMRAPSRMDPKVELETQGASIAATSLAAVTVNGLYRFTYYVRVTRAASTSSSILVTIAWTDGGVNLTAASAALTGNATTTYGTGTYTAQVTAGTTPTYATTYATSGATSMQYRLSVTMEQLVS